MMKIVIVDDSSTARMIVRRCLEIAGCRDVEFLEAANGKEALFLLKEHSVGFVVTDLNMPVIDGEMLLKRMKSSPRLNEIPLIILSSAVNTAKDRALLEQGAFAVMSKPISPAQISKIMSELIPEKESSYGY
ncbi:MAG: response regulator [Deltaproteobacteria bacterium]|nr:response regulator [Deltaproteobacteria bacterium]